MKEVSGTAKCACTHGLQKTDATELSSPYFTTNCLHIYEIYFYKFYIIKHPNSS